MIKEILIKGCNSVNKKRISFISKLKKSSFFTNPSLENIVNLKEDKISNTHLNFKNIHYIKNRKFSTNSHNKHFQKGKELYTKIYNKSIDENTREEFWEKEASEIFWFKNYDKILDDSNKPFYEWFKGGETNMVYNCIDRHLETDLRTSLAIIWESAYLNKIRTFTYEELDREVRKVCKILIGNGIKIGDRVIIYMPMIPEAVFSMFACAKLGIIHSVVFGGFASEELATRIKDCQPKMIITASAGIEPKKIIPYYPIVKEALKQVENLTGKYNKYIFNLRVMIKYTKFSTSKIFGFIFLINNIFV